MEMAKGCWCRLFLLCCIVSCFLPSAKSDEKNYHGLEPLQWNMKNKPNVWLASKLLRKKRNAQDGTITLAQLNSLLDTIKKYPWPLLTYTDGKRHTANFTPRLGRESSEDTESETWLRDPQLTNEIMLERSPPFAPRLGRQLFSSHLGKFNLKSQQ